LAVLFLLSLSSAVFGQEILWIRQFGTLQWDQAYDVAVDQTGNVYVVGDTYGVLPGQTKVGERDAFVRKYNGSGNELWTRQFGTGGGGGCLALAVAVDTARNVYIAGAALGALPGQTSTGGWDAFLRKYDAAGNAVWTRQFGTDSYDSANDVAVDGVSNVYVVGQIGQEAYIRKYDSAGNELWTRQFSTAGWAEAYGVAVDQAGNVYVIGRPSGSEPVNFGGFLRKYDSAGNELWTREFGTAAGAEIHSVATDEAGNLYIAGYTQQALPGQISMGEIDAFVSKFNSAGDELWIRQFGTGYTDYAWGVAVDAAGNIYAVGSTYGAFSGQTGTGIPGYLDIYVRKYDGAGNEIWTRQLGSTADDDAHGIAVDNAGNVHISGGTTGTLPGQTNNGWGDAFVAKISAEPLPSLVELHAPWEAGLTRYSQTYPGHGGSGTWNAVDFYTHRDTGQSTGGWYVLAAHDGTAWFMINDKEECRGQPYVMVIDEARGIRSVYAHLLFPPGVNPGDVKEVRAGDIIGIARNRDELDVCQSNPHLHFAVKVKRNESWEWVDVRNLVLDGQRVFPQGTEQLPPGGWGNEIVSATHPCCILSVSKIGDGSGTVRGQLEGLGIVGIDCGNDCKEGYIRGSEVTLTALPAEGSIFLGWTKTCSGTGECTVIMDDNKTVTAYFFPSQFLFFEDFEDITDWTKSGLWHVRDDQDSCFAYELLVGKFASYTVAGQCHYNEKDRRGRSVRTKGTLTSPIIPIPKNASLSINFEFFREVERNTRSTLDRTYVEIRLGTSGRTIRWGSWRTIWSRSSRDPSPEDGTATYNFNSREYDRLQIRFVFDSVNGKNNNYRGWAIDNLVVQPTSTSATSLEVADLGVGWDVPEELEPEEMTILSILNSAGNQHTIIFTVLGVEAEAIKAEVYDLNGRLVWLGEGEGNRLSWDTRGLSGVPLANGVYLYVVRVRGFDGREYVSEVRKLVILR
jgi:hypothetical protein